MPASASATTGAQLQQQAQSRLAASLGANGALRNGAALTKAQAQASGLGYVAQHFDEIDTARTGKVTLKQVQQFIEQRRQ